MKILAGQKKWIKKIVIKLFQIEKTGHRDKVSVKKVVGYKKFGLRN